MGWFGNEDAMNEFNNTEHHGHVTHDLLGAAAAYEATKKYEEYCAANGKPDSHAKAKEIAAGLVGFALTRLAETKGLDAWDAHKQAQAGEKARKQLEDRLLSDGY